MDNLNPRPNPNYGQYPGYQTSTMSPVDEFGRPRVIPLPPPPGYILQDNSGGYVPPPVHADAILVGDDVDVKFFEFNNQSIRRNFIRKVYGILTCQLLLTMAGIAFFIYCEPVAKFAMQNPPVLYTSFAVYFALALILICVTEARRKAPLNYILLFAFTAATTYMLGAVACTMDSSSVMAAVGVTALICFSLTLFAFQTKIDFTSCSGFILSLVMALLFLGIACWIWPSRAMEMAICSAGIVIFSFSFIYHTQLMLEGKHKYSITPEEYVFAALSLYLDVINIFVRILRFLR